MKLTSGVCPSRSRTTSSLDDDDSLASSDLDFIRQASFFKKRLGEANAAGVTDLNQPAFHRCACGYDVITALACWSSSFFGPV
jgi:hypothetical protein